MSAAKHILVLRFSALGDVAMTVPVLKNLLQQHPDLSVTVVSRPFFKPLFKDIGRLQFYPVDVKIQYRGLIGLIKLSQRLKKDIPFDAVADLHDSLRTKTLRRLLHVPVAVIDKGRKEKKELTRPKNKILRPLKTTFERYADVFRKLGIPVELNFLAGIVKEKTERDVGMPAQRRWVGVAPFAKHAAKMYPLQKMKESVRQLASQPDTAILIFGSEEEAKQLAQWEQQFPNVFIVPGKFDFDAELRIISQLDVMVSMDSAPMHLASLFGVPVVSIWGGTHPSAGFYGWGQSLENAIQLDLPCRPSSVFGNKPCPVHGEQGCMDGITPEMVVKKATAVLKSNNS